MTAHDGIGRSSSNAKLITGNGFQSTSEVFDREALRTPNGVAAIDIEHFSSMSDSWLAGAKPRGTLALLEIQQIQDDETLTSEITSDILAQIRMKLRPDDMVCRDGARFLIMLRRSTQGVGHRILQKISRGVAAIELSSSELLTPAVGYVDVRKARTLLKLSSMAEVALLDAKSSLEMEPVRYGTQAHRKSGFAGLWSKAPPWFALTAQFLLSLVVGLGAPFLLYAACDALGIDISGPVYIGVVIVLVLTATMILVEAFMAIKATNPPKEAGSSAPPATIIIAAYLPNEADTIIETVGAFLRLNYANVTQIIVAYNSPLPRMPVEDELDALAASNEYIGRFVIEPVRVYGSTSKAQNVNAVIGRVRGKFVGVFDADHHPRPDSLERAWRWLSNGWDIVQGRCAIRNGEESWVARMVAVEFQQIYAVNHPGRARLHTFGIFGGSNGFWTTKALHETRMRHAMLTEDIDSSIRAMSAGYKIASDRGLVSDELAPTSLSQLTNQRLRWAQGWFQVSLRRTGSAILSRETSARQKAGLIHLLIWRELFPWYSIQVVPILIYWIWAYGWHYIHWAVPIFVATTLYTLSTGPVQILVAYYVGDEDIKRRKSWFFEYLIVSTLFLSPFKDTLSRIAHLKEAMRERTWRITPRSTAKYPATLAKVSIIAILAFIISTGGGMAQSTSTEPAKTSSTAFIGALLGGEVTAIASARKAEKAGQNAQAARLFASAIRAVPERRPELLFEYANALAYSGRSAEAVPLYRELQRSPVNNANIPAKVTAQLALALTWSAEYSAALTLYDQMLTRAPANADVAIHRARVLVWLGRPGDAVMALDRVDAKDWASGPLGALGDEILVEAARSDARIDRNADSAKRFERAIRHNADLRTPLLREYADQLVFTGHEEEAIPFYQEVIANKATSAPNRSAARLGLGQALLQNHQPQDAYKVYSAGLAEQAPGSANYSKFRRGISLSLTWSNSTAKALGAWTAYLKTTPDDADALVHRAQVLASLHDDEEALRSYKAIVADHPQNAAARQGVVEETINLARLAARTDRNADSAALFQTAMDLDHNKRRGLLREYADQLAFTDRPDQAISLYHEVLINGELSEADKRRTMLGLANSYDAAGRPEDALRTYEALAATYPADLKLHWGELVFAARQAAQANRNEESLRLFTQAIAIKSVPSEGLQREYADQLNFSGRSEAAIPIYLRALNEPSLTTRDRLSARKGLALAYDWSGQPDQARLVYDQLVKEYPSDLTLQWSVLVVSAHDAGRVDRNGDAARLLEEAMRMIPARRPVILKDYADKLSFTNRSSMAIPLYREVLDQPGLSPKDRVAAQKGLAQAYDWSDRQEEAKTVYATLVTEFPGDATLEWGLLVVEAHGAAKADRNKEALSYLDQAIRLIPARAHFLRREYADKLTFAGDTKDAIPVYRQLISQGGTPAQVRQNQLALALALSWDGQLSSAGDEYQSLLNANPDDVEARSGLARVFSWDGHQADAEDMYRKVLASNPTYPDAERGLAQAEDWQGHHRSAQAILAVRLQENPGDLQARRQMAQSEVWMGRPDKAMAQLAIALKDRSPSDKPYDQSKLQPATTNVDIPTSERLNQ